MLLKMKKHYNFCWILAGLITLQLTALLCVYIFHYQPAPRKVRNHEYFNPKNEKGPTIYFLETSGRSSLKLRQMAAVESAARLLTHSGITVLIFSEEDVKPNQAMIELTETYGINFKRASMEALTKDTPLHDWYRQGEWKNSTYKVVHLSDALRLLVLWLYGGIYLDLDVVIHRSYTFPNNVVSMEYETNLANSVLAFQRHHPLLLKCLVELASHYKPELFVANGPHLVTGVYESFSKFNKTDIVVLPRYAFFEVYYYEHMKFYEEKYLDEVLDRTVDSIGIHVWNHIAGQNLRSTTKCAYLDFVSYSSPLVYKHMQQVDYV